MSPIIFKGRGLEPDVLLRVFGTEFHVNSVLLGLHSAFFFKFLNSPDKQASNAASCGQFKYEWDTKVEEDGGWVLESASTIQASNNHPEALKGDKTVHTRLFHNLLSAIHREPFMISSVSDLQALTDMADYYCALPALSQSILQPLVEDRLDIEGDAVPLINIAVKLRHKILFREAALFLAGNWDAVHSKSNIEKLDPKIKKVVVAAKEATSLLVTDALQHLMSINSQVPIVAQQLSRVGGDETVTLPNVFSRIYNSFGEDDTDEFEVKERLEELMANNIALHVWPGFPGEGCHKNYFLCSRVPDDDLPWDDKKDF